MKEEQSKELLAFLIEEKKDLERDIAFCELTIKLKKEHLSTIKEVINNIDN